MPALRLSYNHLPFDLQHCFSYCALFPEDYEYHSQELVHFWIGLGLLGTSDQNKRIEDIGEDYLNGLVNYGFLQKKLKEDVDPYYLVHDLLHELAIDVSSHECLSIHGSNLRPIQNPASIRHLSIVINNADVKDRITFETYKSGLSMLGTGLKIESLCSLMLFGSHHGSFLNTFSDLLKESKSLRVIFLSGASYNVEDLLQNFSRLVHLRYLRIKSDDPLNQASIPISTSRFYHLLVLDLKNCKYHVGYLREMSNLVKIRHFVNPNDDNFHSGVFEVGKLKSLQELPIFEVKKERTGFELKQLGKLLELHGSLEIRNLERVEEIEEAKLVHINHLNQLTLHWDTGRSIKDPGNEQAVLENLKPHSSIQKICIKGHGGPTCPTWLGADLEINNLEHLCLRDVAWKSLPPLGKLSMVGEHGNEYPNHSPEQCFQNLKSLELVNIQTLRKWCGSDASHLFDHLEILTVKNCSELVELPFQHSTSHEEAEQVKMLTLFPKLQKLDISDCRKLVSVPRIPWTPSLCKASIRNVGSGFGLSLFSKKILEVSAEEKAQDSKLWTLLCFDNLIDLEFLSISRCPNLPLDQMRKLTSLKIMIIHSCTNLLWPAEGHKKARYQFSGVKKLNIAHCYNANGTELTQLVSYFPKLSELSLQNCDMVTTLGVAKEQISETENEKIGLRKHHAREEEGIEEIVIEEIAQGLLLLPPQIETLDIRDCPNLSLYSCSLGDDVAVAGGLQSLRSLQSLTIVSCPKLLSSSSSSSSGSPFPASLQDLCLCDVKGMSALDLPLNLTRLEAQNCGLRGPGLWRHLTQGQLKELLIFKTPKVLFGTEPSQSQMCEQDASHSSSQLQELKTDDITEIPAMPISSSLARLSIVRNDNIECFTEEQEGALKKLTSLQELTIDGCKKLQYLPAGLSGLPSLKELEINDCPVIKWLPKDGLPSSLRKLLILGCPAIRSPPKGSLPNSLVMLDVSVSGNEELRRQCRKLQGTIPIVRA